MVTVLGLLLVALGILGAISIAASVKTACGKARALRRK